MRGDSHLTFRSELEHALRSRRLLVSVITITVTLPVSIYLFPRLVESAGGNPPSSTTYQMSLFGPIRLLFPCIGLLIGYRRLEASENALEARTRYLREKFVARSLILVALTAAVFVAGPIALFTIHSWYAIGIGSYGALFVCTVLYATAFVGVSFAVSTTITSTVRSVAALVVLFAVIELVWPTAVAANGPLSTHENWRQLAQLVTPNGSYGLILSILLGPNPLPDAATSWEEVTRVASGIGSVLILAGWTVLPVYGTIRSTADASVSER